MPPLARSETDPAGAALLAQWIQSLPATTVEPASKRAPSMTGEPDPPPTAVDAPVPK
jgi:hypothetical protein